MRIADCIVQSLVDQGVNHIFLVTGRGALFLTDAVAKNKSVKPVCMHHEQSAAFAAVAYASYKNGIGACLVSTGCASTNAITGVLSAWQDGIPVIFISGQNVLEETTAYTGLPIRTYGQQEADIVSIVKPITKYSVMIKDVATFPTELEKAIRIANTGKKGPVWIDVPLNLQSSNVDESLLHVLKSQPHATEGNKEITNLPILLDALATASRPAILIGSGIRSSETIQLLEDFVEANDLPVVYSGSSCDIYPLSKKLSIGSVGTMGCSRAGSFTIQNCDLLLVLGNRLSSLTTGVDFCKFARDAKTFVVDIDQIEHSKKSIRIDHFIHCDLVNFFAALPGRRITGSLDAWVKKATHWKEIFSTLEDPFKNFEKVDLYHLAQVMSESLPDDAVLITDSGFAEVILPTNIDFKGQRRCIHPVSQGAMGFALPAIVGAYYASNRPIVSIVGDGSFMMNMQELETIRHHKIPAKIFVINNNVYAIIRRRQAELFRNRTIGTDPDNGVSCPNFEEVARTFGLKYNKVEKPSELKSKVGETLADNGPVLCEILGSENQQYVEVSHVRCSTGKFVRRPLEDQWPFLDRTTFLNEMIINPIDQ